jgi:hypothetical protein
MALRLTTQPLTDIYVYQEFSWGEGRPARRADNITAICEPIVYKMWEPRRLTTLRASAAFYRACFSLLLTFSSKNILLHGVIQLDRLFRKISK